MAKCRWLREKTGVMTFRISSFQVVVKKNKKMNNDGGARAEGRGDDREVVELD